METLTATLLDFFASGADKADALPSRYNYALVLVAYLVAALASYSFLEFADRIVELGKSVTRFAWLGAGAVIMGVGIWAMHFVGMLAYILPIPVSYDVAITVASVLPAILGAAVALHVVARPVVSTARLLIGGVLMGTGIAAMHYGGMEAMTLGAAVRYDPVLFVISIAAAVSLSILALQIRFWVGKARSGPTAGIAGAMILGLAVSAMHFIAMASTYCLANDEGSASAIDADIFAIVTALIASLVLAMAIAATVFDRRVEREIAMRRQADASMRIELERLNSVFQSTGAGILLLDRDTRIVLANHFVQEAEAKGATEPDGRSYSALLIAGLAPGVLARWQAATSESELKPVEYEVTDGGAHGASRIHRITANPIPDEAGRLRYIVLIGVDDTERRLGEIRLFDSARLANLGEMATGMAHEINQPLAVIRMATESLIEELEGEGATLLPPELADLVEAKLERICKQTDRASALVHDLRVIARKPNNLSLPFDIAEAARVTADLVREQLKAARIEFVLDLPPPGLEVRGEAHRLQQVLLNLVLNARDALEPAAGEAPGEGSLGRITMRIAAGPAGSGAVVTIEDDGPGIPAEILPRLFEPFFTTKPAGKGTGLGLSISHDIVRHMGAEIVAENRAEGGARFRITFPPLAPAAFEQAA